MNFLLDLMSDDGTPDFAVPGIDYQALSSILTIILLLACIVIIGLTIKISLLNDKIEKLEESKEQKTNEEEGE